MIQAYYGITYGDYKRHAKNIGICHWHTEDSPVTDSSQLAMKVNGDESVHLYLEGQPEVTKFPLPWDSTPLSADHIQKLQHGVKQGHTMHDAIKQLAMHHPLLGMRGV